MTGRGLAMTEKGPAMTNVGQHQCGLVADCPNTAD